MHIAYLLTGGNEGNRREYLGRAKERIASICGDVLLASSYFESEPWGAKDQATYYNQALKVATPLEPLALLQQVLGIEESLGRVRTRKYGARTIDIDILLFDEVLISEAQLQVPHPHLPVRRFALECLNEIAPQSVHPVLHKTISELLATCPDPLWVRKVD